MDNYNYLQKICDRFPKLMGLTCDVFPTQVIVTVTDGSNNAILMKETTVAEKFDSDEEVEKIKDESAFDLICHFVLMSHKHIKATIEDSQKGIKEQLN